MSDSDMIGKVVSHYRIDKVLGTGGMGAVYLANDLNLQRQVALKVMHPHLSAQDQFQKRFLQEARAAASLDHPGIVRILSFDHTDGVLILVMELVAGGSLRDYQKAQRDEGKQIEISTAIDFSRQIADALHYAHQQGMTHRDIKPDNILLKQDSSFNAGYRCLITDFGLAKLAESNVHSMSGVPMGTFAYMSPEQAEAEKVDSRADIYALGIMLYELTVGKLPYQPRSITEAIRMHSREPLPKPSEQRPGFPADLERVIIKSTAKSPNDRYQTAGDMSRDLNRLKSGAAAPAEAAPAAPPIAAAPPIEPKTYVVTPPAAAAPPQTPPPPAPVPVALPPSQAGMDRLIITGGEQGQQVIPLSKDVYIIGRDSDRDIPLPSSKVSRSHARLERAFDGKYRIIDLGSSNGTFIGETRLPPNAPESLAPGTPVRIGEYWLQIEAGNKAAANQYAQMGFTQLENETGAPPAPSMPPAPPPTPTPPSYPPQPQYTPPPAYTPGASYTPPPAAPPSYTPPPAVGGGYGSAHPQQQSAPYNPGMSAPPNPQQSQYGATPSMSGYEQIAADREQIMLTLNQTQIKVDAGSRVTMSLEVENDSNLVDHFTIQVLGMDEDWFSPPPQTLYLMPKTRDTAQVSFHPPRKPSSGAGAHPFEVRATARAQGLQSAAMQATLVINPFYGYTSTLEPQRIKKRRGKVELVTENKGNTFLTANVFARDREELLNFNLVKKQFVLKPGEKEYIPIDIAAKRPIIIGSQQSITFEVGVVPQEEGNNPQTHMGDLINSPLLPRWLLSLFGISLVGIIALLLGLGNSVIQSLRAAETATQQATINAATLTAQYFQTATPIAATEFAQADSDGDGLSNAQEAELGTDPNNPDTDGDGLSDYDEVNVWGTNPLNRDTDGDGLSDGEEVNDIGTDPNNPDTDGDGLNDREDPVPLERSTATPTMVPTALGGECGGGPPPRLASGMIAVVTVAVTVPLRIREDPNVGDNIQGFTRAGQRMQVIAGPFCDDEDQLNWWLVNIDGDQGYVAEGILPDEYFLEPAGAAGAAPGG
jgi:serine/threonine protein kinase